MNNYLPPQLCGSPSMSNLMVGGVYPAENVITQQKQFIDQYNTSKTMCNIMLEQQALQFNAQVLSQLNAMPIIPFSVHPSPEGLPFPQDVILPPSLWNAAFCVATLSGGSSTMAALLALLGAVSIAARGRYRVVNEATHHSEALVLYVLMMAPSGSRKSALIANIRKPFSQFENGFVRDENQGDGCNLEAPRLFVNTGSGPQIAKIMSAQGGCASVLEAEGDMLLETLCKSPGFSGLFMRAHGMENYNYDSGRQGSISLKNPALPMLLFVQPASYLPLFRKDNLIGTGAIARFLPFIDDPNIYNLRSGGMESREDGWAIYVDRIGKMLARNFIQAPDREIWDLHLDPDASQLLCNCEFRIKQWHVPSSSEVLCQFVRKLHGTAARLAGLLHLWRYPDRPESREICGEDMRSAMQLADFLYGHSQIVFVPERYGAPHNAVKAIRWLQTRSDNGPFQLADVCRNVRDEGTGKNMTATSGRYVLHILFQSNLITHGMMPNGRPGYIARSDIANYSV